MMGKGLRRGGLIGLAELAMGGMALARGISGRCEAKRMLTEMESKPALPSQRYVICRWIRKSTAGLQG